MKRRFQFSLGRLLLAITFLTLLGSHLYTSWKLKQAREDIARLATELGRLNITDPTRLNVVAQPTYEDMTWRWRVHVPTERKYGIYSATRNIPLTDVNPTDDSGIQTVLDPGEYTLTVAARPNHLGQWRLSIVEPTGGITITIPKDDAAWFVDNPGYMHRQAGGHGNGTEAATGAEPFVLLKVNCQRNSSAMAVPPAPRSTSEGLMIWAAEIQPDALEATTVAPDS